MLNVVLGMYYNNIIHQIISLVNEHIEFFVGSGSKGALLVHSIRGMSAHVTGIYKN